MTKPTEDQVKKFWEWCGFAQLPVYRGSYSWRCGERVGKWMPPSENCEDLSIALLPRIDLNNLFEYAVPKLTERGINFNLRFRHDVEHRFLVRLYDAPYSCLSVAEDKDPALALFWAIWEAIEVSND